MTDNLETTTVKETPKNFSKGEIPAEGYAIGTLMMLSAIVAYGVYRSGKVLYHNLMEKALKR